MNARWPGFWQHIPEADRGALGEILAELLSTGVLLGEDGRGRELYLTAREYENEIADYLAPLHFTLVPHADRPILQARPEPGECGLTAKFTKAETLVVLVLWRIYDEVRMTQTAAAVLLSVDEIFQRLKLYFERLEPPTPGQMKNILDRLRGLRLIRLQPRQEAAKFNETLLEILPTLPRVIPFESPEAWEQQAGVYRGETNLEDAS